MKLICSYCKKDMGEKRPFRDTTISHGMCPDCLKSYEHRLSGVSMSRYIDLFCAPIIIVKSDGRIVAANKAAMVMTGRTRRELSGLLGGEAINCVHSHLPEGCGKTVHCKKCSIRNAVKAALRSKTSQMHIPVLFHQENKAVKMVISTEKMGEILRIVVESIDGGDTSGRARDSRL